MCVYISFRSLCGDHIEIYDGQSDQSTLLKKICNSSRKLYFKSSSRVVYLRFQSDSLQGNGTGFVVRFIRRGEQYELFKHTNACTLAHMESHI